MPTQMFHSIEDGKKFLVQLFPKGFYVGLPLGLGKPNQLANALYHEAASNPEFSLHIFTALSLSIPQPKSDLEQKFIGPFLKRHFGEDYPELAYATAQKSDHLPRNIQVQEFYLQSGAYSQSASAQQNYVSLNYTHVAQALLQKDLQVVIQLIAKRTRNGHTSYSLSSNPDLTLDLYDLYKKDGKKLILVGVVHPDLPFMEADAEVPADFFDAIIDSPEVTHTLFALPRKPISPADFLIGLHASRLIRDDGTLQIGIGSLSDALVHATLLRHQNKSLYQQLVSKFAVPSVDCALYDHCFEKGLYGTSEMIMDGFMHLRQAGILKRFIFDAREDHKRFLHGAFFLGSKPLYEWLRNLSPEESAGICMTKVSRVNDLYDENEMALRRQRKNARFFNTCMQVSLLGSAASETLENGTVISGVGGQYNFVAMSSELPDSHSILMLRSTRMQKGKRVSTITWNHGYSTIPRHLRDIVITEYGIASLRGKSDSEVIEALLAITDSEFQPELIQTAIQNKKLRADYILPEKYRHNTPEKIRSFIKTQQQHFPPFPFGSDFTPEEETLALALSKLKKASANPLALCKMFQRGLTQKNQTFQKELKRMQLEKPKSIKDWLYQKLVLGAL